MSKAICMFCDGCGWCEGSPAFICPKCGGSGVEPKAKPAKPKRAARGPSGGEPTEGVPRPPLRRTQK